MAEQAVTVESLQEQLRARDAEIARLQAEVKDLRSRLVRSSLRCHRCLVHGGSSSVCACRCWRERILTWWDWGGAQVNQAELQEQHGKLMQRVRELSREKEMLAVNVEQEEEMLTNTLQKKLERVSSLISLMSALLRWLSSTHFFPHTWSYTGLWMRAYTHKQLRRDKVDLENQLETEQEYITNRLHKHLRAVLEEKEYAELMGSGLCYTGTAWGHGSLMGARRVG